MLLSLNIWPIFFYKWLQDQGCTFPVIVFVDGHKSHLTYHLSLFCSQNGIILIALPPNCTHIMQPLDVALFGPVKKEWSTAVHEWRLRNGLQTLTKYNFGPLLKEVLDSKLKVVSIVNGFKRCGLCPFDATAIDYTKVNVMTPPQECMVNVNQQALDPELPGLEGAVSHRRKDCLVFFEEFINPDVLSQFKETYKKFTPIWAGEVEYQGLYVAWKKAMDFVNSRANVNIVNNKNLPTPLPSVDDQTLPPATLQEKGSSDSSKEPMPGPSKPIVNKPSTPSTSLEKLANVLSPETSGDGVPSPFKNHLFWPGTPPKTKGRTQKVKLPSVVTSEQWQKYEAKKRDEKKKLEEEKAERKKLREVKKLSK